MIPYFAIDLETTGLNWDICQVLEFGAVYDHDGTVPLEKLPRIRKVLKWPIYIGEPYALWLNHKLFKEIDENSPDVIPGPALAQAFGMFLQTLGLKPTDSIRVAGKNFPGFDANFLRKLDGFGENGIRWKHRVIDLGNLLWEPDIDTDLPNSQTCRERAGIEGPVEHKAIADCLDVVQEVRYHVRRRNFRVVGAET